MTVTNTISRDLGELKISKVFDAGDSGFTGTFAINYDCDDGEAYDGTVNLAAGGTKTISGIPTGTQCTVTETTLPTPPTGWSFGTPTYTPTDGTVTISETLAEVVVTNTIRQDVVSDLSQLTTAKTTCIQFSSGLAPDLERLLYTPTYNKKTGDYVIKSVTPSSFLYYVKAILPADASTLVIAQENHSGFPAMLPSVTLYDGNCVRLSPTLTSVTINSGNITINFTPGEDQRIIYAGVKYSARPVIGQVVNAYPDIDYSFSAALDGAAAYTSDDLSITFFQ